MGINSVVTIIGRPNVGKSCLFNRCIGRRQAIVEKTSGVTRDRMHARVYWVQKEFELIDTGGIHFDQASMISKAVINQAKEAIKYSSLILFVVDFTTGLTISDKELMQYLRSFNKNVILVVNKVDNMVKIQNNCEFFEFGLDNIQYVSALHGLNIDGLLDAIVDELKLKDRIIEKTEKLLKIAIVGRPNVGKSSFLNNLLKEERVIVDDQPGTTRDTIDTTVVIEGRKFILIDTAGIRQRKKPHGNIDFYARSRAIQVIKRADVCIVLIDAQDGIRQDDLHIFELIKNEGKGCVVGINKCDLVKLRLDECIYTVDRKAPFMKFAYYVLCSAKKGKHLNLALRLAVHTWANAHRKIKQRNLAKVLTEITAHYKKHNSYTGLKFNYLTQVRVNPPTFVLIVNRPELVKKTILSYIENYIRKSFDFKGVPIRFKVKKKQREKRR